MPLGSLLYRVAKRLTPLDITYIFLLSAKNKREELASDENVVCRILSLDDLRALSTEHEFAISDPFLNDSKKLRLQTVGAVVNDKVVAICCFAHGNVPAYLNTGGKEFQGIGLALPENTTYLFKVFVKNDYRGKRLVSLMIQFALSHKDVASDRSLVTTSDINNVAFKNAIMRVGFESVGSAAEAVISGKHFFKLPAPIRTEQRSGSHNAENPIVLKKPEAKTAAKAEPA